jgi:hypothetical protein
MVHYLVIEMLRMSLGTSVPLIISWLRKYCTTHAYTKYIAPKRYLGTSPLIRCRVPAGAAVQAAVGTIRDLDGEGAPLILPLPQLRIPTTPTSRYHKVANDQRALPIQPHFPILLGRRMPDLPWTIPAPVSKASPPVDLDSCAVLYYIRTFSFRPGVSYLSTCGLVPFLLSAPDINTSEFFLIRGPTLSSRRGR